MGVLENSGGIAERAIKILLEAAKKGSGAKVIFEKDPTRLVKKIMQLIEKSTYNKPKTLKKY